MVITGFILGTILGSFVKALADRSLRNGTFWGRSYCPHCKKILQWYDLLPILSYIFLKGRCRYCGDKIGMEYLVVEVGMGVLIGFLFWQQFNNFQSFDFAQDKFSIFNFQSSIFILDLLYKIFFISTLAVLFLTDLKKMFIPDRITLPAIGISITFIIVITVIKIIYLYNYLSQTVLGRLLLPPHSDYFLRHAYYAAQPFLGSLLMGLLIGGFFMTLIIITKGKGMGGGDVKLGALMGLGLGFPNALVATMLAFLLGAGVAIVLMVAGKKRFGQSIPFGPFLVLGSLIALFWGERIINWYLYLSM
ncbi:prepilin peptidase [Candidatus Microgenomates bacterium]|nr:prepilin peptidase [Candidatus Microgenomates bacterium]